MSAAGLARGSAKGLAQHPATLLPRDFVLNADALSRHWTLAESENHTRWLATHHYENFHVVSFLLPKELHQDFYNVYAYCRWSDDLADEIGDPAESLRLLDWWSRELDRMYAGETQHPVFVALRGTVKQYGIPRQPFADLIRAFIQDQRVTRYQNWDELFGYCEGSANPVGRLVLYLCGYSDPERQALSDATCTALQLANFWQDVTVDQEKDRVYLPLDLLARHNYTVEELFAHKYDERFRGLMKEAVEKARGLFLQGLPLIGMVNRRLSIDLDLFSRGGMCVLDKIAGQNYDVLSRRPSISKVERVWLLAGTLVRAAFSRAA
jgi:squalene synthase HpnC